MAIINSRFNLLITLGVLFLGSGFSATSAYATTYYNFTETSTSSTRVKYTGSGGSSTVVGNANSTNFVALPTGSAFLDLYFTSNTAVAASSKTILSDLTSAGQFNSGTISFNGGTTKYLLTNIASDTYTTGGALISSSTFKSPNYAAGSLQLQFTASGHTYYVYTPPDADRLSIYSSAPSFTSSATANTNTVGACTTNNCWATTITVDSIGTVGIVPQATQEAGLSGALGAAPEIDGSLAPKVGFLLGCLFLMFGRKKATLMSV